MHTILRDVSETLSDYLLEALKHTEGPLGAKFTAGDMEVSLNTPEEMRANMEGLSAWLYWVVRDDQRLNAPTRRAEREEWPRALPLRLHYLMTPILKTSTEKSPETEQLILGRVLQALHDRPVFRGPDLAGELAGRDVELRARLEPTPIEEITRIWDALETSYQLSVSYEVAVAYVESALAPRRFAEVSQAMAVNAGPSSGLGVVVAEEGRRGSN